MKKFGTHANLWSSFAILVLVAVWTFVNLHLKIYFSIIILAVFCLALWFSTRPDTLVVAIPILFVILVFTQSILAWNNLKITNLRLANNFRSSITKLMTPDSGTEILPEPVLQIHGLLDSYDLTSYRLTEKITADALIYQRTIESTCPITENPGATYIFGFIGDIAHYGGCSVIEQRQDVELGICR